MARFAIFRQEFPHHSRPYRLVEVYATSDGPRTRICDGLFATREEAMIELERKNNAKHRST